MTFMYVTPRIVQIAAVPSLRTQRFQFYALPADQGIASVPSKKGLTETAYIHQLLFKAISYASKMIPHSHYYNTYTGAKEYVHYENVHVVHVLQLMNKKPFLAQFC
jgi:hypothetical protein